MDHGHHRSDHTSDHFGVLMDATLKKQWVDALRSGEYKQGFSYFVRDDKKGECRWCAIGVLLDLAIDGWWEELKYGHYCLATCNRVLNNFELTGMGDKLGLKSPARDYILMNDSNRWSFERIADYIERNE